MKIFAIRILSLTYSSSSCESNWSTFGIVRPNDFGILSPSWEFSIKTGTTLSTLKRRKLFKSKKEKRKKEWVGICYVKLEDKRENSLKIKCKRRNWFEELVFRWWVVSKGCRPEDDSIDFDEDNEVTSLMPSFID